MLDVREYSNSDRFNAFFNTISNKNSKTQRRFSDEQIKSLEIIFQSESKLEPRKKLQLAKDLGLQPRQVAIWFQNKRARWKSKQLEREYDILRASYDSLSSQFDLLNRENQSLSLQLKKLHELIEKKREPARTCNPDENSNYFVGSEKGLGIVSDDGSSIKAEYSVLEEGRDMLVGDLVEQGDGSLTSTDNWDDLDSNPLLDQSTIADTSNQWWDIWS